jgi:DNA-binding beta-propeller fold protein YncE
MRRWIGLISGWLLLTACLNTVSPTAVPQASPTLSTMPAKTATSGPPTPFSAPSPPTLPSSVPTPLGSTAARVEAVIPVEGIPFGFSASRGYLWVLQRYEPFPSPGAVVRIDMANDQIVGAPIQLNFDPWSIAATSDAVWVAKNGPAALVRIDSQTRQIVATIDIDASLVAADAQGVWVSGAGENSPNSNTTSRVDPTTNHLVGTPVPVGMEPIQLVAGAGSIWVGAHSGPPAITRIDSETGKVVATIEVGFPVHGLGAGPTSIWAADYHGSRVVQISVVNNQIVGAPISLPFPPYAVAVSANDAWVGVSALGENASPEDDRVVRIDPHTNTIVDTLHVGGKPLAMLMDDHGALWVALGKPNRITKLVPQPFPTQTPK